MADAGSFPLEGGYEIVGWLRSRARELGPTAVPSLAVVAKNGSVPLRAAALLAMTEIDPDATESFVVNRARLDPSAEVREAATRALGDTRGEASLAYLLETIEDRAARIALRARLSKAGNEELVALARAAGAHPVRDRQASVCLALLVERRALPEDLAFAVVRAHVAATPAEDDDFWDLLEIDREVIGLLGHANPVRVLEELALLVRSGRPTLRAAIVEMLDEQLAAAWTDEARGFDDDEPPRGLVPEAGWLELLEDLSLPEDAHSHVDVADLRAGITWTYLPRVNAALRRTDAGAEEGAAFVLAGFDVDRRDEDSIIRVLDGLGGRMRTNLHLVDHQCGGNGCTQYRLLGIPLGSKTLTEELAPHTQGVIDLIHHLDGWRQPDRSSLAGARAYLQRFVPDLPELVGGTEALAWTAPGRVGDALGDLDVVRILPAARPWRQPSGVFMQPQDVLRPIGRFDEHHERLLAEVGARLGLGLPRIFVLWANSD